MKEVIVSISDQEVGNLFFDIKKMEYGFNYTNDLSPVSLTMPFQKTTYTWKYHLHPN